VEDVNYSGGEMMYTNPAYSTLGDEGVVPFSKDKLNNASGWWLVGGEGGVVTQLCSSVGVKINNSANCANMTNQAVD